MQCLFGKVLRRPPLRYLKLTSNPPINYFRSSHNHPINNQWGNVPMADEFSTAGYYNGIAHITCSALRFMPGGGTERVLSDQVVVAHLRMNLHALAALKGAIALIEEIMKRNGASLPPPPKRLT